MLLNEINESGVYTTADKTARITISEPEPSELNPRNDSNLGAFFCPDSRRGIIEDSEEKETIANIHKELGKSTLKQFADKVRREIGGVVIEVAVHDHSGITIYEAPDYNYYGWDRGPFGLYYASKRAIVDWFGKYSASKARKEMLLEMKTFNECDIWQDIRVDIAFREKIINNNKTYFTEWRQGDGALFTLYGNESQTLGELAAAHVCGFPEEASLVAGLIGCGGYGLLTKE